MSDRNSESQKQMNENLPKTQSDILGGAFPAGPASYPGTNRDGKQIIPTK